MELFVRVPGNKILALHLAGVLARDLREELRDSSFITLSPAVVSVAVRPEADMSVVEAAFRSLGYVLRYDAGAFREDDGALESLRRLYGPTLGH